MKRGKILRQLVQVPGLGCRESGVRQQSWRRARVCIEEGDPIRQSRPQTSFAGGSAIRLGGRHGPTFTKKMILAKSSQAWKLTSWDWIQTVSLRTYQKRTQPARGLWMGWHFTLHCRLRMGTHQETKGEKSNQWNSFHSGPCGAAEGSEFSSPLGSCNLS